MADLFETRKSNFPGDDLMSFNLAAVSEALDLIQKLSDENVGGEVVESRLGEYKSWDPDVFKVDKDAEDGYIDRLKERGQPVAMLSEEVERLEIGTEGGKAAEAFVVSDPFDGSYLFKRGIPDFWYSSLAFFNLDATPQCCAVGDGVHKNIAFANADGAFIGKLKDDQLVDQFKLDKLLARKELNTMTRKMFVRNVKTICLTINYSLFMEKEPEKKDPNIQKQS